MASEELDLGPIEAHIEQADQDYYLTTHHPVTLKCLTDLLVEVKRLREEAKDLETYKMMYLERLNGWF